MIKTRKPTRAMIAKAQRDVEAAREKAQTAFWAAVNGTEHRHDEPCGQIIARASDELRAAYEAASAHADHLIQNAIDRTLAWRASGSLCWY